MKESEVMAFAGKWMQPGIILLSKNKQDSERQISQIISHVRIPDLN